MSYEYRFTDRWGFLTSVIGPHCDELRIPVVSLIHDPVAQQWVVLSPIEWTPEFVDHLKKHEKAWLDEAETKQ